MSCLRSCIGERRLAVVATLPIGIGVNTANFSEREL